MGTIIDFKTAKKQMKAAESRTEEERIPATNEEIADWSEEYVGSKFTLEDARQFLFLVFYDVVSFGMRNERQSKQKALPLVEASAKEQSRRRRLHTNAVCMLRAIENYIDSGH
jgi:hypothetical protein